MRGRRVGGRGDSRGGEDPCRAHPLALGLGQYVDRSHSPALTDFGPGAVCSRGACRRRRISANERDPGGPRGPGAVSARDLALAMAERRGGLGARLARRLAGLGVRRERKGKRTPEEARSRDR